MPDKAHRDWVARVRRGLAYTKREKLMEFKNKLSRIWAGTLLVLFALAMLGSTGCSVYNSGLTLPNPYYLKNRPQYHPRGTEFPFPNEAAVLQDTDREQSGSPGF